MTAFHHKFALFAVLLPPLAAGCGGSAVAVAPEAATARKALERALDAWKAGSPPGTIAGTTPPITATDSEWQRGAKLASYEILREEPSTAEKCFTVRLAPKGPATAKEARFVVLGTGPVWVFREEDYLRQMNMDEAPKAPAGGRRRR